MFIASIFLSSAAVNRVDTLFCHGEALYFLQVPFLKISLARSGAYLYSSPKTDGRSVRAVTEEGRSGQMARKRKNEGTDSEGVTDFRHRQRNEAVRIMPIDDTD
jgi:hypothetical protein